MRKQSRYFNRVTDFAIDNAPVLGGYWRSRSRGLLRLST